MLQAFKEYLQTKTSITDEQFQRITEGVITRKIKKDSVLLKKGDVTSYTFFVMKGLLRAYSIDEQGKEHVIQFAPENNWVGDRNSFCFNEPAIFIVDAIEDSEVVCIDQHFFERTEQHAPQFNRFNVIALNNLIRFMQRRVNLLLSATAEQRYLDFIELYPSLTLRVPQWMIASYLGITPESLSRVRKELAKRNFKG